MYYSATRFSKEGIEDYLLQGKRYMAAGLRFRVGHNPAPVDVSIQKNDVWCGAS
jgi:hypothetical protein